MRKNRDWAFNFEAKTSRAVAHFVDFKTGRALCGRRSKRWKRAATGADIDMTCCLLCLKKKE